MYSGRFIKLFGKERKPEDKLEEKHYNLAATLQKFTEETLLAIVRNVHQETKLNNLCLSGGLFLNCVANGRILAETPFKNIFVQPAAGDSGGAIGVAAYIDQALCGNERDYVMQHAYLGPDFSAGQIRRTLSNSGLESRELTEAELLKYVANKIAQDKIIGWFQGRMEVGPRALGNRSILANPGNPEMKDLLNSRVKKREWFRPYAPAILAERAQEFFELPCPSPFMLLAANVKEEKRKIIPAVTHVDGTARIQTVTPETNLKFWKLIKEFERLTGIPVLLNTSFNLRGEPIVCTPQDAIGCFQRSQIDCLVLGNYIIEK